MSRTSVDPENEWLGRNPGIRAEPDLESGVEQIGPHVWMYKTILLEYGPIDFNDEPPFAFDMVLVLTNGRYEIRRLDAKQLATGGPPVTSESLRKIKPRGLIIGTVNRHVMQSQGRHPLLVPSGDLARKGPTDETLRGVGVIYAMAQAAGEPPVASVMNHFRLKRPTAARWVTQAREVGHLWPAKRAD